jgi:hypothetical protein
MFNLLSELHVMHHLSLLADTPQAPPSEPTTGYAMQFRFHLVVSKNYLHEVRYICMKLAILRSGICMKFKLAILWSTCRE